MKPSRLALPGTVGSENKDVQSTEERRETAERKWSAIYLGTRPAQGTVRITAEGRRVTVSPVAVLDSHVSAGGRLASVCLASASPASRAA